GIGLLPVLEVVGAKDTTRFIDGIEVVNQKTSQVLQGTVDLGPILDRRWKCITQPTTTKSSLRRSGNVAVAEIDIPGIPKQMAAHSRVSEAGKGLIGSGNGLFTAQTVPNKAGDMVHRGMDTEYKIFDNIAGQLGNNTSIRGTVNILTEKAACASCLNVAEQFKAKYPNVEVNISDNQGVMLRPPRKTQ
ncbi:deaminase domain-containing protein, partial [Achromobacter marplatensis]|uniref:deaminase domain-containing protein n=1 Tax=Achromobacter marplatensis TaxID=470868 RepID=UPI0039F71220